MQSMGWRRGDRLICVQWGDMLVLRKLDMQELADAMHGGMMRRERGEEPKHIEGEWDKKRNQDKPHP
jgi:hypothetical protein